jgi:hypothetical protein
MVKVFGPIDLVQLAMLLWVLSTITVFVFRYSRKLASGLLADRARLWQTGAKRILRAVAVPTTLLIIFLIPPWFTAEVSHVDAVPVKTNSINTALCDKIKFLQCSFPRVNCSQFQRAPNGTWRSCTGATLVYPDAPGSFAFNTIGPHMRIGTPSGSVDLTDFLDQTCGKQAPAMPRGDCGAGPP